MALNSVYLKMKLSNDCYTTGLLPEVTFSFLDDKEDVCTQTENVSTSTRMKDQKKAMMHTITNCKEDFLRPVKYQRQTSFLNRDKTLSTMKLLKEKHRENERLRHHSLNQHLRLICKKVPGSAEDGKETKVVMMQRIISYIAFLENTIKYISSQLNIRPDPSWLLLTSNVKEIEKSGLWEFSVLSSDDSEDNERFTRNMSYMKLSSPAVNSITESTSIVIEESQDSVVPSTSLFTDIEDKFEPILSQPESDHKTFEIPLHTEGKYINAHEEMDWLESPKRTYRSHQDICDSQFGIKFDSACLDDSSCDMSHTVIVSPNQVLPQVRPQQMQDSKYPYGTLMERNVQRISQEEDELLTNCRSSKRKQLSPKRAPLYDIGNWLELPSDCQSHLDELNYDLGESSYNTEDSTNKLQDLIKKEITENNSEVSILELANESSKVLKDANLETVTNKLDLRKSSWMNGFMMYSRIHRKHFIKENPGLQAASISKLMGQRWRGMTVEQQTPYREQARICSQELQRMLDESYHC